MSLDSSYFLCWKQALSLHCHMFILKTTLSKLSGKTFSASGRRVGKLQNLLLQGRTQEKQHLHTIWFNATNSNYKALRAPKFLIHLNQYLSVRLKLSIVPHWNWESTSRGKYNPTGRPIVKVQKLLQLKVKEETLKWDNCLKELLWKVSQQKRKLPPLKWLRGNIAYLK